MLLNNELVMECPEGFHVMTEEERGKINLLEDGQWVGLSDPDRHMMITIGWKELGGIMAKLMSGKSLAENIEKQISKGMAAFGYESEGSRERQIAGMDAAGFGYKYAAQGIDMVGEAYAAKKNKTAYYFYLYAREELKSESLAVWEEFLRSLH